MGLIGLALVSGGFLACGFLPLLAAQYVIFVGAVTGIVGLFAAGNVASQFVERKGITDQNVAITKAQAASGQTVTGPAIPEVAPGRASADLDDEPV